jgi:hypothetical protein
MTTAVPSQDATHQPPPHSYSNVTTHSATISTTSPPANKPNKAHTAYLRVSRTNTAAAPSITPTDATSSAAQNANSRRSVMWATQPTR